MWTGSGGRQALLWSVRPSHARSGCADPTRTSAPAPAGRRILRPVRRGSHSRQALLQQVRARREPIRARTPGPGGRAGRACRAGSNSRTGAGRAAASPRLLLLRGAHHPWEALLQEVRPPYRGARRSRSRGITSVRARSSPGGRASARAAGRRTGRPSATCEHCAAYAGRAVRRASRSRRDERAGCSRLCAGRIAKGPDLIVGAG